MKYIVFFSTLFFAVPVGSLLASRFLFIQRILMYLIVFFTCRMNETINFVSRESYRGTTRGFEIALVDLLALTVLLSFLTKRKFSDFKWFPLGTSLYFLFFSFSLLSFINSSSFLYSAFELTKLIRMYFFLWVMTNFLDSKLKLKWLYEGIGITIVYIFLTVLYDKYILGYFQAKGPFPHQNSMVMYSITFGVITFGKFMFSKGKGYLVNGLLFGMTSIVIISSLSRAGMAFYLIAIIIVIALKLLLSFTKNDVLSLSLIFFVGTGVLFKASDSIIERFSTAPKESKEVRVKLAIAAVKMANDKAFGIGLNNFGLKINYPYPYSKGNPNYYNPNFRGGIVETAYLLVAAETGWHNMVIYICLLLWLYVNNIFLVFKKKYREFLCYTISISGGLLSICLESTLEWVLRQTTNFYQLMLIFALINSIKIVQRCASKKDIEATVS